MKIIFKVIDSEGYQRLAFDENKALLRSLSDSRKLFCPYCRKRAFFHGGDVRIHHFNHEPHVECSFMGEPESQEHLRGKLLIYKWLKNQYPDAYISLEQRIKETNQIADVYVEFRRGEKFAFEVQCSEITAEKWKERRKLYRSAGIRDIWLFGAAFYSEVQNDYNLEDKQLLRLKSLLQLVNDKDRNVYFIDVETMIIKQIGTFFDLSKWSDTRVLTSVQAIPLNHMKIIPITSPCHYVLGNEVSIDKIQYHISQRSILARQIWDTRKKDREEKNNTILRTQEKQRRFTQYNKYLDNFSLETTMQRMTVKEQVLFKKLLIEYDLTDTNFPGIFYIQMDGYRCIQTPYPFWQLLVFHKAIQQNSSKKQLIFPPYLFQDLRNEIRFEHSNSKEVAIMIHSYLVLLEKCGFLEKKSYSRKYIHPFSIKNRRLPTVKDKEFNKFIALYYSEFNMVEIGWKEAKYTSHTWITNELQQKLRHATRKYKGMVLNNQHDALSRNIEISHIELFRAAVKNQNMELTQIEEDFLEEISQTIREERDISQGFYDTFQALLESKLQ